MEPDDTQLNTKATAPSSVADDADQVIDQAIEQKMDEQAAAAMAEASEAERQQKAQAEWVPGVPRPRGELPRKIAQLVESIEKSADEVGVLVIQMHSKPGKKLTTYAGDQAVGMTVAMDMAEEDPREINLGVQSTLATIGAIQVLKRRAGL
jgi:hypothetical protein